MISLFRASVAALVMASALLPATLERLSLDDMILKSTAIVRASVQSSYSIPRGALIYTQYRLQITERWKGPATSLMDIVVPGGSTGGFRQTFSGAPELQAGREYILFLWTGKSGLTHVIGLSQGAFNLDINSKGEPVARRAATSETMLDSRGQPVKDHPIEITLTELAAKVSELLGGGTK